jgi:hypothetical protein
MVALHPNILEKDGKRVFVVLSYEEFLLIEEELQDFEDLKELRAAKSQEAGSPTTLLDDVRQDMGI